MANDLTGGARTAGSARSDFTPVSLLGTIPFVLTVCPSLPVKSVDDLI